MIMKDYVDHFSYYDNLSKCQQTLHSQYNLRDIAKQLNSIANKFELLDPEELKQLEQAIVVFNEAKTKYFVIQADLDLKKALEIQQMITLDNTQYQCEYSEEELDHERKEQRIVEEEIQQLSKEIEQIKLSSRRIKNSNIAKLQQLQTKYQNKQQIYKLLHTFFSELEKKCVDQISLNKLLVQIEKLFALISKCLRAKEALQKSIREFTSQINDTTESEGDP